MKDKDTTNKDAGAGTETQADSGAGGADGPVVSGDPLADMSGILRKLSRMTFMVYPSRGWAELLDRYVGRWSPYPWIRSWPVTGLDTWIVAQWLEYASRGNPEVHAIAVEIRDRVDKFARAQGVRWPVFDVGDVNDPAPSAGVVASRALAAELAAMDLPLKQLAAGVNEATLPKTLRLWKVHFPTALRKCSPNAIQRDLISLLKTSSDRRVRELRNWLKPDRNVSLFREEDYGGSAGLPWLARTLENVNALAILARPQIGAIIPMVGRMGRRNPLFSRELWREREHPALWYEMEPTGEVWIDCVLAAAVELGSSASVTDALRVLRRCTPVPCWIEEVESERVPALDGVEEDPYADELEDEFDECGSGGESDVYEDDPYDHDFDDEEYADEHEHDDDEHDADEHDDGDLPDSGTDSATDAHDGADVHNAARSAEPPPLSKVTLVLRVVGSDRIVRFHRAATREVYEKGTARYFSFVPADAPDTVSPVCRRENDVQPADLEFMRSFAPSTPGATVEEREAWWRIWARRRLRSEVP